MAKEKLKSGYAVGDEPVQQRSMTKLTRWEMETTINFNMEEKTAILYTRDRTVMRKLDKLVEKCPDTYKLIRETDIDKTYEFPKRLLSYRMPRVMTDEQREASAERLAEARARKQAEGADDVLDDDLEEDDFMEDEENEDCGDE